MTISENLRKLRTARGLSQTALSKASGITQATISDVETGRREHPHDSTMRKLATALGATVEDLVDGEGVQRGTLLTQLTAARMRHGVSRKALARRTGIPGEVIGEYEAGTRLADDKTVGKLASAMGAFRAELFLAPEAIEAFLDHLAHETKNFRPEDPFYEAHADPKTAAEETNLERMKMQVEANAKTVEAQDETA